MQDRYLAGVLDERKSILDPSIAHPGNDHPLADVFCGVVELIRDVRKIVSGHPKGSEVALHAHT